MELVWKCENMHESMLGFLKRNVGSAKSVIYVANSEMNFYFDEKIQLMRLDGLGLFSDKFYRLFREK